MRSFVVSLLLAPTLAAGCLGGADGGVTQGPEPTACESPFRLRPAEDGDLRTFAVVGDAAPVPLTDLTYEVRRDHDQRDVVRGNLTDPGAAVRVTGGEDGLSSGDVVRVEGEAAGGVLLRSGEALVASNLVCH